MDRVVYSISVPVETKVRLKLLAMVNNITMSKMIERIVNELWEKDQSVVSSNIYTKAITKEFRRLAK